MKKLKLVDIILLVFAFLVAVAAYYEFGRYLLPHLLARGRG